MLSHSLNKLLTNSRYQGFRLPRGSPSVTHLGYADDILIFSSALGSSEYK